MAIVKDICRFICGLIDSIAYLILSKLSDLFNEISQLSLYSEEVMNSIGQRIGLILGIFMLFRLAVALVSYIISPDTMKDSGKGTGKMIKSIIISLILLATVNIIFKEAYKLQRKVIESKIVEKIFFGEQAMVSDINISFILYDAFIDPNPRVLANCETLFDLYNPIVNSDCKNSINNASLNSAAYNTISDSILRYHTFQDLLSTYDALNAKKGNEYVFNYTPVISTISSVIAILILIGFCMDLATRIVKLLFLQIIAPVPIVSNMAPGKGSDVFKNWYKQCINTYLSVFIRIIALNFGIFMITLIKTKFSDIFTGASPFITVLLIIGCLMFAKQVPKLLEEIMGIKMDGGMTLNPLKKFQDQALFGKNIIGLGAAGLAGTVALGSNAYARTSSMINKFRNREFKSGFKQLGLGLISPGAGLISATSRGLVGALKGEKFGQIYNSAYGGAIAAREKRDERRDDDVGPVEVGINKLQRATKQKTRGQRADALDSALESYKKNGEAIKNAIYANDKAKFAFNGYDFDGAKGLKEFIDNMQGPTQGETETAAAFAKRQQNFLAYKKQFQDELDRQVSSIVTGGRTIDDNAGGTAGGSAAQSAVEKILASMDSQRKFINNEGTSLYGAEFNIVSDAKDTTAPNHMSLKNSLGSASGAQTSISSHAVHDRDVDKYGAKKDSK